MPETFEEMKQRALPPVQEVVRTPAGPMPVPWYEHVLRDMHRRISVLENRGFPLEDEANAGQGR